MVPRSVECKVKSEVSGRNGCWLSMCVCLCVRVCIGPSSDEAARCKSADKGSFPFPPQTSSAEGALNVCLQKCEACEGCLYVTFSYRYQDCSWYRTCRQIDAVRLEKSDFLSGAMPPRRGGGRGHGALAPSYELNVRGKRGGMQQSRRRKEEK